MTILTSNLAEVNVADLRDIAVAMREFRHERALALIETITNEAPRIVRVSGEDLSGPDLAEFRDAALDALVRLKAEDYSGATWQVLMLGDLLGVNLEMTAGVTRF